jgi:hypothetical protein
MKAQLSRAGMVALLKGGFGQAVASGGAAAVAGSLAAITPHSGDVDVVVESHDARFSAAASVTIVHPGAGALEAKHAYLAKAGRAAGYKVKGR